jgi:hypothetical protein
MEPLLKELKDCSIVILAQNFNPSIFNQYWLIHKDILKEEEVLPNSIFTPAGVQVFSKDFNLLIMPDQLNLVFNNENSPLDILIKIIKKLPEIPYKALGINFNYKVYQAEDEVTKLSQEIFFNKSSALYKSFHTPDARYGAYMSRSFKKSRLKLDIKPCISQVKEAHPQYLLFNFNFHIDLPIDNPVVLLRESINSWNEYYNETNKILLSAI